jgi:ketosteroid isomerase-like protein
MGKLENKELIRNMFVEMSKGNAEAFLGNLADNVCFTVIGTTRFSGTFIIASGTMRSVGFEPARP